MKGLIMAGGEGTRLRPLTCGKPKPMLEIMGKPVMEYIIGNLKAAGITEIAVTLMYLSRSITDYFGDGSRFGVTLRYFTEQTPLGTAGSVKNAQEFLDDEFVIISGDCLTDIDLTQAVSFHQQNQAMATLVLKQVTTPEEYGLVVTDDKGKIVRFVEKPSPVEVLSDAANTGIYIVNPNLLDLIECHQKVDFSKDVFPLLLSKKLPLYGFLSQGYWCDIGDLHAYRQCHFDILDNKISLPPMANQIRPGVFVQQGATIAEGARLDAPCYIGKGSVVYNNAHIMPYTVLGENCRIAEGASTKHSVLHSNVSVASAAQLRGCIIANGVHIGSGAHVLENAVIGEQTYIGEQAQVGNDIKIWPHKNVGKETIVRENLVWGNSCTKKLFGEQGISGELNVDITPEFAARIGAAFGAMLPGAKIGVSSEYQNSLLMLKYALISGLMSTGAVTTDFGALPLPAMCRAIPFYGQDAGIHIDATLKNGELRPSITFLNKQGADISRQEERKLESLFMRQDFVRCEAENIKPLSETKGYQTYYNNELLLEFSGVPFSYPLHLTGNTGLPYALLHQAGIQLTATGENTIHAHIEPNGQRFVLSDETGRVLSDDLYFALVCHIALLSGERKLVAPIIATSSIEQSAEAYQATVVRCKTGKSAMMNAMLEHDSNVQFRMLYDPCYALCKLISFLSKRRIPLHQLIDELPNIHIVQREIPCEAEKIGGVMQAFSQKNDASSASSEGVRIMTENGWVVLLPHPSKPRFRIISESTNAEFATELCDFYEREIKQYLK